MSRVCFRKATGTSSRTVATSSKVTSYGYTLLTLPPSVSPVQYTSTCVVTIGCSAKLATTYTPVPGKHKSSAIMTVFNLFAQFRQSYHRSSACRYSNFLRLCNTCYSIVHNVMHSLYRCIPHHDNRCHCRSFQHYPCFAIWRLTIPSRVSTCGDYRWRRDWGFRGGFADWNINLLAMVCNSIIAFHTTLNSFVS